MRKNDNWASREEFAEYIRRFHGYQGFSEQAFQDLAQHGVVERTDGRFWLAYPKRWEAHVYTTPPWLMQRMAKLPMPIVAIRGKPSFMFADHLWHMWQRYCPDAQFLEDNRFGHLMPLENPEACLRPIDAGLTQVLSGGDNAKTQ